MLYTSKKLGKENQHTTCDPKKAAIYLKLDQYLVQGNFYTSIFIFLHFSCSPHFRPLFSGFVNIFTYNGKDTEWKEVKSNCDTVWQNC